MKNKKHLKIVLLFGAILTLLSLSAFSCKNENYRQKEEITVTFDSRGGEPSIANVSIYAGESVVAPKTPIKAKSAFKYWYLEQTPTEPFNFNTPIKTSTTLYAQWTQNVFTVSFDTRGGVPDVPEKVVNGAGGIVSIPTIIPTKPDSVFTGWYASVNEKYDFGLPVRADAALHAKYAKSQSVVFDNNLNDGKNITLIIIDGERIYPPAKSPQKSSYIFSGWYKDKECTSKFDFSSAITSHLTLYAGYVRRVWLHNICQVSRVTGETLLDETRLNPNATASKFNVGGTDLGISWVMDQGQVGMFFGDTYGSDFKPVGEGGPGSAGDWRSNVLAFTDDTNLDDGINIHTMALDPNNSFRAREIVPRRNYLAYTSIPTSAIRANGKDYVHYMDFQVFGGVSEIDYSGLYCSGDNGKSWDKCPNVRFESGSKFSAVAFEKRDGYVYMIGTPTGRVGEARLARFLERDIEDKSLYEYWNGKDWIKGDEKAATVLINKNVGEMSLMYHKLYERWILTYNGSFESEDGSLGSGIIYAQAVDITGPWTMSSIAYPPGTGWGVYCAYMYKLLDGGDELYFTSSTWQEYNVFLFKGNLDYWE